MSIIVTLEDLKRASKGIVQLVKSVIDRLKYKREFSVFLHDPNNVKFDSSARTFLLDHGKKVKHLFKNNTQLFVQMFFVLWTIKSKAAKGEMTTKRFFSN